MLYQILLTGDGPPVLNVDLTEPEVKSLYANIQRRGLVRFGAAWLRPDEVRAIVPAGREV